jgi:hypothetical protein
MGNCQVRFCRRGWRSDSSLDSNLTIKRRRGNPVVGDSTTNSTKGGSSSSSQEC